MEQFFYELSAKFPAVKFLKSVSSVCIPNYPDKNLPTVFVYRDGELRKQFIGAAELGGSSLSRDGQYDGYCCQYETMWSVSSHCVKSAW